MEHELVRRVVSERKSGYAPLSGIPCGGSGAHLEFGRVLGVKPDGKDF